MTTPEPARPKESFYAAVGGEPTFRRLVADFYAGVRRDPVLLPLYPPDELEEAQERLTLFLIQYWGGPQTYGEQRGHPRLRMRHAPFAVGPAERDAWLARMKEAVDGLGLAAQYAEPLWDYLHGAAYAMQNTP
ncbi:MAG TPA: globin [Frankiaceae bacterium]|nr:globin [Frankiaceae bacterium]